REFRDFPDLVIMDHRMPLMSCIDALIEILAIDRNARIIFVSADDAIKEQTIQLGALEFIRKPFDIHQLLIVIEKIMNSEMKI
ncbi:MAG: response regulator, partial [Candidatus Hermodarchaeota archaeon]